LFQEFETANQVSSGWLTPSFKLPLVYLVVLKRCAYSIPHAESALCWSAQCCEIWMV